MFLTRSPTVRGAASVLREQQQHPVTTMLSKAELHAGARIPGQLAIVMADPHQGLPLHDEQGKAAFDEQHLAPLS